MVNIKSQYGDAFYLKTSLDGGLYDSTVYVAAFIAAIELGERRAEVAMVGWLREQAPSTLMSASLWANQIELSDHRSKPA